MTLVKGLFRNNILLRTVARRTCRGLIVQSQERCAPNSAPVMHIYVRLANRVLLFAEGGAYGIG